ncbi:MAG TPA: hypothetical protein VFS60_03430 [Thermoanaerobaculia bacterium]|nr:hypothetical protein [Thermoanaerobaculia bacterium]
MPEASSQQDRFSNELTSLRGQIEYLNLYELRCERIDRGIKIALALASNGSIAAWAVWREFAMLWGAIIAGSQFLAAIKDHLPFEKRLKCVRELSSKLEGAFVQWEKSWNSVANGEFSNDEINSRLAELKLMKVELLTSCIAGVSLPENPRLLAQASAKAAMYFKIIYSIKE